MSSTQIRIPKPLMSGALASFGVLIIVSLILTVIVALAPASPTQQILFALHLNRGNSLVYSTANYHAIAPEAEFLDAYIATPLAMLAAGAMLGRFMRKMPYSQGRAALVGFWFGLIFSLIVVVGAWALTQEVMRLSGMRPIPLFTRGSIRDVLPGIEEILLSTAAYTLGAWLAARSGKTRSSLPPRTASQTSKVA